MSQVHHEEDTTSHSNSAADMIRELRACPAGSYDDQTDILGRFGQLHRPSRLIGRPTAQPLRQWGEAGEEAVIEVLLDLLEQANDIGKGKQRSNPASY